MPGRIADIWGGRTPAQGGVVVFTRTATGRYRYPATRSASSQCVETPAPGPAGAAPGADRRLQVHLAERRPVATERVPSPGHTARVPSGSWALRLPVRGR